MTNTTLLDCGHPVSPHSSFTTGYAVDDEGKRHCYKCCADRDRASMVEHGDSKRLPLYLIKRSNPDGTHAWYVSNWPGSLEYRCYYYRIGCHNIAGNRYDVWFVGPDDFIWHGVQYGGNTEIVHCKRTVRTKERR